MLNHSQSGSGPRQGHFTEFVSGVDGKLLNIQPGGDVSRGGGSPQPERHRLVDDPGPV